MTNRSHETGFSIMDCVGNKARKYLLIADEYIGKVERDFEASFNTIEETSLQAAKSNMYRLLSNFEERCEITVGPDHLECELKAFNYAKHILIAHINRQLRSLTCRVSVFEFLRTKSNHTQLCNL